MPIPAGVKTKSDMHAKPGRIADERPETKFPKRLDGNLNIYLNLLTFPLRVPLPARRNAIFAVQFSLSTARRGRDLLSMGL